MHISTHADRELPLPRPEVFDHLVASETFPRICRGLWPVAGIADARMVDGAPLAAGAERLITLDDGVVLREDILALDRPREHAYRWSGGLRVPLALLVRSGEGRWTFTDAGAGTRVHWAYTFELTTPLLLPVAKLMVLRFRGWMRRVLERAHRELTEGGVVLRGSNRVPVDRGQA